MDGNSRTGSVSILVVEDDPVIQKILALALNRAGFVSTIASNGLEALSQVKEAAPDLIISDVMMPEMDGFAMLKELRSNPKTSFIPVIMLTSRDSCEDIIDGMNMGADDYLPKPFDPDILIARVSAKISRPPVPAENLIIDRQTGLLSAQNFIMEAERELYRSGKGGKPGALVFCEVLEMARLRERLGEHGDREIAKQLSEILQSIRHPLDIFGYDSSGRFMILIPENDQNECLKYLKEVSNQISNHTFIAQNENIRLTPVIGFSMFDHEIGYKAVAEKAQVAFEYACSQMDLEPKVFNDEARSMVEKLRHTASLKKHVSPISLLYQSSKTAIQFLISMVMYLVIPYFMYWGLDKLGVDITPLLHHRSHPVAHCHHHLGRRVPVLES
jgi:PleD family two-component response regulator